MMKKRIVALLLAGLMTTAALTACRVQGNFDNPNGTEPNQGSSSQTTTTKPEDIYNPPSTTFEETDELVYATGEISLRKEATNSSTELAKIPVETELHCTKKNTSWYFVEYNGQEGYVSKTNVTKNKFVPINEAGSKVMYANEKKINVRLYPYASASIEGSYNRNDEVTVIASNGDWYKIQYSETKTYYVSTTCLSDTKWVDPLDDSAYDELFNQGILTDKPVMYTTDKVNLRATPRTDTTDNILTTLAKGRAVTVTAKATLDNGSVWVRVVVEILPENEGDGIEKKEGYISFDYLSLYADQTTLDSLLSIYPEFTKRDPATTMYVVVDSTIFIRSTPNFPGKNDPDNYAETLGSTKESIRQLTVLADGTVDDVLWYIVEYTVKEGETEKTYRGFVGGKALQQLTTDPEGKLSLTLEGFLGSYSGKYDILETPVTVTTNGRTNCYVEPNNSEKNPPVIEAGTEVLLVAQEKGVAATWAVIKNDSGYYFVYLSKLNQAN